jgi:hypothetical protein
MTETLIETKPDVIEGLVAIEKIMRAFVERFASSPEWHWAPATARMVKAIETQLKRIDDARRQAAA